MEMVEGGAFEFENNRGLGDVECGVEENDEGGAGGDRRRCF
jgi:hypothetical protein